jgi:hypothetical protein
VHTPGRHLHDEQHIQAPEQDRVHGEEITRQQALRLGAQERPVGAENPVTLCDLGILADQAAEPVPPYNPDVCA